LAQEVLLLEQQVEVMVPLVLVVLILLFQEQVFQLSPQQVAAVEALEAVTVLKRQNQVAQVVAVALVTVLQRHRQQVEQQMH
jgi:hypothetical protein